VTDRPTKSHSTVFLLSKRPRYFYDADAIREPHLTPLHAPGNKSKRFDKDGTHSWDEELMDKVWGNEAGANARSVWTIPTQPTPFAHFATWPQKLVGRMIQAGTSEHGKCPVCGKPWVRDVEKGEPVLNAWSANGAAQYDDDLRGMRPTSLEQGSTLKHL